MRKNPSQILVSLQSRSANLDRFIAADPIERLLATMEVEIRVRTRRVSHPHVSLELDLVRSFKADLEEALRDARAADVIGNVKDAARRSNRAESTVRRICSKHGELAGATMVEGQYSVHLPTFLRFLAALPQPQGSSAQDRHDVRPSETDADPVDNHEPSSPLEEAA